MVQRDYWVGRIEKAWRERSVVWLAGVRRAGKTVLSQSLSDVEYFDCERPRTRQAMEDPEAFLDGFGERRIVLDEIHRLPNPAEMLKIAADHYPKLRILATGSSTLAASGKFRDTLAGRKRDIWLTPMCSEDVKASEVTSVPRRLLRGGLPPFLLAEHYPEADFAEWTDAFWARDIQELFRLERRASFQKFLELLMVQSGGLFEASRFAAPCEISRTTVANYLKAIEATFAAHIIRPFNSHRAGEIVAAPKVYGFDTGFVAWYRGWAELRQSDLGPLWEHLVLNEIMAHRQDRGVLYWRDKRGHEVDFVVAGKRDAPVAIECKWSAGAFDPAGLKAFRAIYPKGANYLVAQDVVRPTVRQFDKLEVRLESLGSLAGSLAS
jgi:predicted AAA+ superfamily ATPase